jgi:hypothetical protein
LWVFGAWDLMFIGTGWEFTKLLKQIRKIFRNFKVLLLSCYP